MFSMQQDEAEQPIVDCQSGIGIKDECEDTWDS